MSEIIDLNGEWDLVFDPSNNGLDNRWYAAVPTEEMRQVQVPHIWEEAFARKEGSVAFYYKKFDLDASENAKRIFLRFERVSVHATLWINGKKVGENLGSFHEFEFDISKSVKPGDENIICVRVSTNDVAGKIEGNHHGELPVGLPWTRNSFTGIFGNVSLVLGQRACIRTLNVIPDQDAEKATLEMKFSNPRNYQARMRILITNPAGELGIIRKEIKLDKEDALLRVSLQFKELQLWSLETPNLYKVEVYLEKSFGVETRFGFRKFDCLRGADFYLNDMIVKLRGVIYTQDHPNMGLITRDTKKLREELEAIRNLGFNCIRSGGAPLSAEALNLCDEIGLLVFQDLPIYNQRSSKSGLEMVHDTVGQIVNEGNNHPSLVTWVLGAENGTMMLENGTKLLKGLDQHDSTRPAFSNLNNVFADHEQNSRKDTGKLLGVTTKDKIMLYASHRIHPRMHITGPFSDFLRDWANKDSSVREISDLYFGDSTLQDEYEEMVRKMQGKILATTSNHSLLPSPALKSTPQESAGHKFIRNKLKNAYNNPIFSKVWKKPEDFTALANESALRSKAAHVTAIQSNSKVSGFFLDEWADSGSRLCGLIDEQRKDKETKTLTERIAKGTRLLVTGLERDVHCQEEICFHLTLLNELRLEKISVKVDLLDAKNKKLNSVGNDYKTRTSYYDLGELAIESPAKEGRYTLQFTLTSGKDTIDQFSEEILVLQKLEVDDSVNYALLDEAEDSAGAFTMAGGESKVLLISSPSSWNEKVLKAMLEQVRNGKTVIFSELDFEDIDFINDSGLLEHKLEGLWATGANGAAWHYVADNKFFPELPSPLLDETCASLMPAVALRQIEGAEAHLGSFIVNEEGAEEGVALQILPYGNGKIIFNQMPVLENLETSAVADMMFCKLVEYAWKG